MKRVKRTGTVLLCILFILSGCGKKQEWQRAVEQRDEIVIGIAFTGIGDYAGESIVKYTEYLADNFDVSFTFSTIYDAYSQSNMILELCEQGADVIFNAFTEEIPECLQICEEYGVYFLQILDYPTDSDIIRKIENNPYYLGYIIDDEKAAAELVAQNMIDYGCENIGIITLSSNLGLSQVHAVRTDSLENTIISNEEEKLGYILRISPLSFTHGISNLSQQNYEFDGLIATTSTFGYTVEEMKELFHNDQFKISYFDISDQTEEEFKNGDLLMVTCGQHNIIGLAFAYAYHYLQSDLNSSAKLELVTNYIALYDLEDYNDYMKLCVGQMPYSADEIDEIIDNLDRDNQILKTYAQNYSLDDVKNRNK